MTNDFTLLEKVIRGIYGKHYDIDRVCVYRGNIGLYDGRDFNLFISRKYIETTFGIKLGNLKMNVEDLDLFGLIQKEKTFRIKLKGTF